MTATSTTLAALLLPLFPEKKVLQLAYTNNPLLGLLAKNTTAFGESVNVMLQYGSQGGRSATFATAQTNSAGNKYSRFVLTPSEDFAVGKIAGDALIRAQTPQAVVDGLKQEMEGSIYRITRSLASALYGNGGGAIGQISTGSTVASASITLENPNDVINFEVGDVIAAASTDGTSGSLRTGTATISAINRDTGTLTTAGGNWSTQITSLATGDYFFQEGDFGLKLKGLGAWIPSSAPGATSFFGVDRSVDVTRLGGVRITGSGAPVRQTVQVAMTRMFREGAKPTHLFLHPDTFNAFALDIGSSPQYIRETANNLPAVGYDGISIVGPAGNVKCFPDPSCPSSTGYLLQLDTFKLYSTRAAPHLQDYDGMKIRANSSANTFEWRYTYLAQLGCTAPGWNCNIAF